MPHDRAGDTGPDPVELGDECERWRSRLTGLTLTLYRPSGWQATVRVRDGKKLVHEGIKVEFVSIDAAVISCEPPS